MLTLHDQMKRIMLLRLLWVIMLGGVIATLLHGFVDPHPLLVSRFIPPGVTVISAGLAAFLYRKPDELQRVLVLTVLCMEMAVCIPILNVIVNASQRVDHNLVDHLPPITSILYLLTILMLVFFRPKQAVIMASLGWGITVGPIFIYLWANPQELGSPRGLDLIMTLGPGLGVNILLVLFYGRLQSAFETLEVERLHLKELSERDALTGLYNRGTGEKLMNLLLEQRRHSLGIILVDIDRFKAINDTFGHAAGDRVLKETVRRCLTQLREGDVFIRWGGEEFLVLIQGISPEGTGLLAERLRVAIAQDPMDVVGTVTASFGVSYSSMAEGAAVLLQKADHALYQAKNSGRNKVVASLDQPAVVPGNAKMG